jgi:aminoglycoside/choline kinase family phosphotransferase
VGRRRYFRLHLSDALTVIGVVYPEEEDGSRRRWVAAHRHLGGTVRVPALLADDDRGHQIVEDFGHEDLAARCAAAPAERAGWLARSADTAAAIAQFPDPGINPAFDAALFRREIDLAREAVFDLLARRPLSAGEREVHDAWADALVREILGHPAALCHRDFHGNNLFPVEEHAAVIDFQDARRGPDSYDIASLLWERTTLEWMDEVQAAPVIARFARRRGLEVEAFTARLERVLLQRAWKVCGTFARAVALGKGESYRRFLPFELALVRRLLRDTGEDRAFAEVLRVPRGAGLLSS